MTPTAAAVINFVYFTANFPYDFIEQCWGVDTSEAKHFRSKLESCQRTSKNMSHIDSGTFLAFFFELSRSNQEKLADWIEQNYHHSEQHRIATKPDNGLKVNCLILDECKSILTFEFVTEKNQHGIKCLKCGLTSFNPNDIANKYCGNCAMFHEHKTL